MSITVNRITKLYGKQKALDAVSLNINPGEIVGLLGPNGAGKSTLMKILTCFIPPTSGDASVCGFDILEQSIDVRKKVGYLPENNPLYTDLYVREFLLFIGNLHFPEIKNSKLKINNSNLVHRIEEIIELTGLRQEIHKKIGALSKGYRQRVGLAQALLHDPEVLILDEPTSGLDPNQILEIRALIKEMSKEKTIMLSTHILQEVEAICERVIIIHKGKIVADDLTQNLRNLSASDAIIRVEFSKPISGEMLRNIPGVLDIRIPDAGYKTEETKTGYPASDIWHLVSSPGNDIRADVFNFAVENKLTVLSLQLEIQRLEEVFKELTKN